MRGLPGSGKSTVAKKIAGDKGVILTIDKYIVQQAPSILLEDKAKDIYESIFKEFEQEIAKGTELIVIDNVNLREWEFAAFVHKAQKEHYFVGVVSLPHPDIKQAVTRSTYDVNEDTITTMMNKWEPFS